MSAGIKPGPIQIRDARDVLFRLTYPEIGGKGGINPGQRHHGARSELPHPI
jgi:hypothetical protein